jgi:tetratricopeptide (TPR) repeat protein
MTENGLYVAYTLARLPNVRGEVMNVEDWLQTVESWAKESSLLSVLLLVVGVGLITSIRWMNRNRLVIKPFTVEDKQLADGFNSLGVLVESELRRAIGIHQSLNDAAGDPRLFHELAPHTTAEDLGVSIVPAKFSQLMKVWIGVLGYVFSPPTVEGRVYLDGTAVNVRATLFRRGQPPNELDLVTRASQEAAGKNDLAREFAMRLIFQLSPGAAVASWQALDALTEALSQWPQRFELSEGEFQTLSQRLQQAQAWDQGSPLISYSLGLLHYGRYAADHNRFAYDFFDKATRTTDLRLQSLASTGAARCLCQDYHRFGLQSPELVSEARRLAQVGVELLETVRVTRSTARPMPQKLQMDRIRALFCKAFAYHVTEIPEDLLRGQAILEQVVADSHPKIPHYVYNNLGYVLMVRAGRYDPGNHALYLEAKRYLQLTLAVEPRQKFALANLGNVERLLGQPERAIRHYTEAVAIDPNYANGWAEMSWALLEANKAKEAESAFKTALGLAQSDGHRSEVTELYARGLFRRGRGQEALQLGVHALSLNSANVSLRGWLDRVSKE